MPFIPFIQYFPELGERETRCIILGENHPANLPAGEYGLIELFCDEPQCDCRRVMFMVVSAQTGKDLATIAYGWESPTFYARWMGTEDLASIRDLYGVTLNLLSRQSRYASEILAFVKDVVLKDPAYIERIKRHYHMFRDKIEQDQPEESKKSSPTPKGKHRPAKKGKRNKRRR